MVSMVCAARQMRGARTEADDVVVSRATMHDVTRPRVILDPPDEPLWAALDLTDPLLARHGTPGELVPPYRRRVQHDSDLA